MVVGAMAMVMYELFSWIENAPRLGAPGLARRVSLHGRLSKLSENASAYP